MTHHGYTKEEVVRRGRELHDRTIQPCVEADHLGQFLVRDITTGDYEIADDDLTASDRAMAKNPEAVLYGVRIGSDHAYRLCDAVTL